MLGFQKLFERSACSRVSWTDEHKVLSTHPTHINSHRCNKHNLVSTLIFFESLRSKKRKENMTSGGGPCQLCVSDCYNYTGYPECEAACQPGYNRCYEQCAIPVMQCLVNDCFQSGLCNEALCASPPTPCQMCKDRAYGSAGKCQMSCLDVPPDDHAHCMQDCDYKLANNRLRCYEDRECCEDFSQRSPASLLGQLRMKSMRRNAPLRQANYRRPQQLNIPVRNVAQQSPHNGKDDRINPMLARY